MRTWIKSNESTFLYTVAAIWVLSLVAVPVLVVMQSRLIVIPAVLLAVFAVGFTAYAAIDVFRYRKAPSSETLFVVAFSVAAAILTLSRTL